MHSENACTPMESQIHEGLTLILHILTFQYCPWMYELIFHTSAGSWLPSRSGRLRSRLQLHLNVMGSKKLSVWKENLTLTSESRPFYAAFLTKLLIRDREETEKEELRRFTSIKELFYVYNDPCTVITGRWVCFAINNLSHTHIATDKGDYTFTITNLYFFLNNP
jgi:hypothetical protein